MYLEMIEKIKSGSLFYSRSPILVCSFNKNLAERIGDSEVYISEFVTAKILGYLAHLVGHPEITKDFLKKLPEYLNNPNSVLMRLDRLKERYIICGSPSHRVVLEIKRNGNFTEINTVHLIREETLLKLEGKCIFL